MKNKIKVHCLGPKGTHGHEVTEKYFGSNTQLVLHGSNLDILFAVENDIDLSFGVVPIENSTAGPVWDVLTGFWLPKIGQPISVELVGGYMHKVRHCLATKGNGSQKIKRVFSHPQALRQCYHNLRVLEQTQGVKIEETATTSTSGSIKCLSKKGDAVICSAFAARLNKLNIVEEEFNDNDSNETRFHVVTNKQCGHGGSYSSVIFTLADKPHSLVDALLCISGYESNMHIMHSIPTGKTGNYAFYVEFDESVYSNKGQKILNSLNRVVDDITVLGTFNLKEKGGQS